MKYIVVATKWSEEEHKQAKAVVGEFPSYMHAEIYKKAYNDFYKSDAKIMSMDKLVNE